MIFWAGLRVEILAGRLKTFFYWHSQFTVRYFYMKAHSFRIKLAAYQKKKQIPRGKFKSGKVTQLITIDFASHTVFSLRTVFRHTWKALATSYNHHMLSQCVSINGLVSQAPTHPPFGGFSISLQLESAAAHKKKKNLKQKTEKKVQKCNIYEKISVFFLSPKTIWTKKRRTIISWNVVRMHDHK